MKQGRGRLSERPPFTLNSLQEVSYKLDDFLPSALLDGRVILKKLENPEKLDEIMRIAVANFIADFQRVEEAVVDVVANEVEGGIELVRGVWPRTTEEVSVLLS